MGDSSVLVVGLDGVDSRYIDQFAESLETITNLRADGASLDLESVHPPWTGAAWPSMYTGLGPGSHGVFDFFDYSDTYPDEASSVNRTRVKAPAIWNYLSASERRSVVLNVPITHPADEISGAVIPGYLAPSDEGGHPSSIRTEITEAIGKEYSIYSEHETATNTKKKIDGFEELIELRADAAVALLERENWDFGFVQVQKTDAVFHNSSSHEDFEQIYKAADEFVRRVLSACDDETTIILCSDHGIGPVGGYTIYVNEILRNHGFVETDGDSDIPSVKGVKADDQSNVDSASLIAKILNVISKAGVSPGTAYNIAARLGVEDIVLRFIPNSAVKSLSEGVDWRESRAFCRSMNEQGVRVNLKGRDSAGIVPEDEYESVRDEIIEILSSLETPDGEPAFEMVCRREEVYEGPYTDDACDVLFLPNNMNHLVSPRLYGEPMTSVDTYSHKKTGVFTATGPVINEECNLGSMSLIDVAPLVFASLGEPIPERLDGSVPEELVTTNVKHERYEDISYAGDQRYTQDQQDVEERLSDLGYL